MATGIQLVKPTPTSVFDCYTNVDAPVAHWMDTSIRIDRAFLEFLDRELAPILGSVFRTKDIIQYQLVRIVSSYKISTKVITLGWIAYVVLANGSAYCWKLDERHFSRRVLVALDDLSIIAHVDGKPFAKRTAKLMDDASVNTGIKLARYDDMPQALSVLKPRTGTQSGTRTGNKIPPRVFKQSLSKMSMPPPWAFLSYDPQRTPKEAYMFTCTCTEVMPDSSVCEHVTEVFKSKSDLAQWINKVTSKRTSSIIEIGVPLFSSIVHRIAVESEETVSWDDQPSKVFIAKPHPWFDKEYTRFYDAAVGLAYDQMQLLETSLKEDPQAQKLFRECIVEGRVPFCTQKSHNFGTNNALIKWLRGEGTHFHRANASSTEDRYWALTFCMFTYEMCYICYRATEPTFSLLSI